MVRLAAYGSLSCAAAAYVVFSAFRLRSNFFAAAVYLSKSNASMMVRVCLALEFYACSAAAARSRADAWKGALRPIDPLELWRLFDRYIRPSIADCILWFSQAYRDRGE